MGGGKSWGAPTIIFDAAASDWSSATLTSGSTTVGDVTWYGRNSAEILDDSHNFSDGVNFTKYLKTGGSSTIKTGSDLAGVLAYTPTSDGTIKVYLKGQGKTSRNLYITQTITSTNRDATAAISSAIGGDGSSALYAIAEAYVEADKTVYIWIDNGMLIYGMTFEESNSDLTLASTNKAVAIDGSENITYTTSSTGAVSVVSSAPSIATVSVNESTKTITIDGVAEGSATITVTQDASGSYTKGVKKISVNVYNPANVYTLSSASESISLEKDNISGQPYLNVSADKWQSSGDNTWDGLSGNFFNLSNTERILTIKVKGVTAFAVREQNATADRTYGISVDGVEKKVITHGGTGVESSGIIETGSTDVVTITINGKGTGSTYPIRILLYQETVDATVGTYEWATFVSDKALDFTGSDVKAYIVTGHSGSAITKSDALTTVAANTPLLLNASEGTYVIPVAASGTDYSATNLLKAGNGSDISPLASQTAYVLSAEDGAAKFVKVGSIKPAVPTGKAYLLFNEEIAAREFLDIDIDGVSTGIKNMKVGSEDNVYYDLQGRRVLYPTKGLYIVNGKKVVIK